jgi:ribosomal protein S27AE
VPYLAAWLSDHPIKNDKEAPLWVNLGNYHHLRQINYVRIRSLLQYTAERAGVKKRVNPHSFRHARATFLANHLTEFQMNQYLGWVQGSNMPSTYIHMSGKNTDAALLRMHGIKVDESKEVKLAIKKCPRCTMTNASTATFCVRCGGVIDEREAAELDEKRQCYLNERTESDRLMNMLFKDPEVVAVIRKKLAEVPS